MKTLLKNARVFQQDHSFLDGGAVLFCDGVIEEVGTNIEDARAELVLDLEGDYLLPGLVDVHTHGRAGYDFNDATREQMLLMKKDYALHGVTSVMATLASDTKEGWCRSLSDIEACGFSGVHFEGRFLNAAKRGAHAAHLLSPLDGEELCEILRSTHLAKHVSAALELDEDGSFLASALACGASVGLGHTMATAEQARDFLKRGATSFTHLFNAMPPLHHREGGPVSVALCEGGFAELIVDGVHICPDMVRLAYRNLGSERTVLITDSMAGTGCPDGNYSIAGLPVIVKDGRALTVEGAIAGSTLDLFDGMKNLMRFADVPLADAVACATVNPARMVGIDDLVGSLDKGKRADAIVMDRDGNLTRVFSEGVQIKGGIDA